MATAVPVTSTDALKGAASQNLQRPSDLVLIELDDTGSIPANPQERHYFKFQYFPAEVTDTKNNTLKNTEIPGASLPIYQWVNGGERSITFTAMFSCDNDLLASPALSQVLVSTYADRNVDIRAAVAWLRRYMLPSYEKVSLPGTGGQAVSVTVPPKRLRLFMPNSGIGLAGGFMVGEEGRLLVDSVTVLMNQCQVTWEAYHESGVPKLASVQLGFVQVPQFAGMIRFPTAPDVTQLKTSNPDIRTYGYRLKPSPRAMLPSTASSTRSDWRTQAGGF